MRCPKCGKEMVSVNIPCPDNDPTCCVLHSRPECVVCKKEHRVNIKPDATLAELIVFINGMFNSMEITIVRDCAIPKGIERHFDDMEDRG